MTAQAHDLMPAACTVSRTNATTSGRVVNVVGPRNALSTERVSGGRIPPSSFVTQQKPVLELLPAARSRRGAVHQDGAADAVGMRRGEGAPDHPAPRVADEMRALGPQAVEDVDDAASAVLESEWRRELSLPP